MKRSMPGLCSRKLEVTTRKADEGDDSQELRIITGYGAVFYNADDPGTEYWLWDDEVERIMPGAFDRAIKEDDVRSFFNHDANLILGRNKSNTLTLTVDDVGLRYEATAPDTPVAQHVTAAIGRGDVDGSSFMFRPTNTSWRKEEIEGVQLWIREIHEVRLWEVGPVVFPAYESSTSELRSAVARDPQYRRYTAWLDDHVKEARAELEREKFNCDSSRQQRSERSQQRLRELGLA